MKVVMVVQGEGLENEACLLLQSKIIENFTAF